MLITVQRKMRSICRQSRASRANMHSIQQHCMIPVVIPGLSSISSGLSEKFPAIVGEADDKPSSILIKSGMQLPQNYYLGVLCDVLNDPDVKMLMTTAHLKADYARLLRKTYQEKLRDFQKTTDPAARSRLEVDLSSLQSYIDEVIHRHGSYE